MYVGNQLIRPRWMKVSKTPWTSLKAASGGYGRRVYNSAISDEMPPFMHIDEVDAHDAHAPIKRALQNLERCIRKAAADARPVFSHGRGQGVERWPHDAAEAPGHALRRAALLEIR